MEKAFSISLDVAHALHPNYPEKSDITNEVILGGGVVLKSSASQRYVTDSEAGAVVEKLSRAYGIKIQRQVNRSGMPGGQTLGPIMSSYLPVKSVDMGIPVLAMHSASELASAEDYLELVKLLKIFYGI
jgi:aspartyl aminopeptidase